MEGKSSAGFKAVVGAMTSIRARVKFKVGTKLGLGLKKCGQG